LYKFLAKIYYLTNINLEKGMGRGKWERKKWEKKFLGRVTGALLVSVIGGVRV